MSSPVEEKQNARKLKADQEAARRIQLYHTVFNTKEGREVLADLNKASGLNARIFTLNDRGDHAAYDPINAALKDGARGLVIYIHEILSTPMLEVEKTKPNVKKS